VSGHAAALRFAGGAGLPAVLDFRDLPVEAVREPSGRHGRFLADLLARARRAVTVSPSCREWLGGMGGGDRVSVVMNGFEEFGAAGPAPAAEGPFFAYAGTVYPDRQDLAPFLGRLEALAKGGGAARLEIAGKVHGEARARLERFERAGLLRLRGFLDRPAMEGFLRSAAAILVWAWEGEGVVGRSQVPVKLFDAMAAGRPILLVAGRGSDAEEVGRRAGLDPVAPDDAAGLESAMRRALAGRDLAGLLPDAEAIAPFRRRAQAEELARILDRAIHDPGTAPPSTGRGAQGKRGA
jgi:glycosyltransferase involved in cell wall biosynthesis